jgi:mRNA interferase MazF
MPTKIAALTVQNWGNSLAVHIPANIARSAHFELGTQIELMVREGGIVVKPSGERKLTLEERLDIFDPKKTWRRSDGIETCWFGEVLMSKEAWASDRGEIIWIDFNLQSGREMRNKHSILVLSPKKFNSRTGIVIGFPITTANYNDTNPLAVRFEGQRGVIRYVLAHQPKSFDWCERKAKIHLWKRAPNEIFVTACELLNQIVDLAE